jgi:plasmid stability protein
MAQVLVRDLDDHVVARLKEKAAARGLPLERFLCEILTAEARLDREELLRRAAEIRARAKPDPEGRTILDELDGGRAYLAGKHGAQGSSSMPVST